MYSHERPKVMTYMPSIRNCSATLVSGGTMWNNGLLQGDFKTHQQSGQQSCQQSCQRYKLLGVFDVENSWAKHRSFWIHYLRIISIISTMKPSRFGTVNLRPMRAKGRQQQHRRLDRRVYKAGYGNALRQVVPCMQHLQNQT